MGNALLSYRGLELAPANVELPPIWSQADGTFNNIWCNTIIVANPPGPAQVPGLEVLEYENSPTDFSKLEITAQPGGPFQIQTVGAGGGSSRNLDMTATDQLILSAGGLIQLETFSPSPIVFGTNGVLYWEFDPSGEFIPLVDNNIDIGNLSSNRVRSGYIVNVFTNQIQPIGGGNLIIGNSGQPFWDFVNNGAFANDADNPNPIIYTGSLNLSHPTPGTAAGNVALGNSTLATVPGTAMLDWVVNVNGAAYRVHLYQ